MAEPGRVRTSHAESLKQDEVNGRKHELVDGEAADRGERFREYRSIESLQHYVLIGQARVMVELFRRGVDGRWTLQEYGADGLISLPALQIDLPVRALYEGLDLPA